MSLVALLGLSMPDPVHALPCEEEVAKAAQALDVENRQILALELTNNSPQVQAFRRQYNLRSQVFLQMKAECDLVTVIHKDFRQDPTAPPGTFYEAFTFDTFRVKNGKLVEHWGSPDRFAMLTQLGLLPQRQPA